MQVKSIRIVVSGKVQGVFFRKHTREKAKSLLLKGFVRNEADGTVCMEVTGQPQALEQLIAWIRDGVPMAIVNSVVVKEIKEMYGESFQIKYF